MPSTTRGYPFPDGSARVGDFDQHVKALAEFIDAKLKTIQSGRSNVTIPSGSSSATRTITFPEPFTEPPNVALSVGESGAAYSVTRNGKSANTVGFTVHRPTGAPTSSSATLAVEWVAHG